MIPIIGDVLSLVEKGIDKIWPDANTKEQAKAEAQLYILKEALEKKKILFMDLENAREVYKEELRTSNVPAFARFFQVLARPFTVYCMVGMYLYAKIGSTLPWLAGKVGVLTLGENDYYLIGSVFVFLFGARTLEKIKGKA